MERTPTQMRSRPRASPLSQRRGQAHELGINIGLKDRWLSDPFTRSRFETLELRASLSHPNLPLRVTAKISESAESGAEYLFGNWHKRRLGGHQAADGAL